MIHPYLADYRESQLEAWRKTDLRGPETADEWTALQRSPVIKALTKSTFAANAERRALRDKEKK